METDLQKGDVVMLQCSQCGKESLTMISGMCSACFSRSFEPEPLYKYKCPKCNGQFNESYVEQLSPSITENFKCPFCGKVMKGLK